ncbi:MAG TPA: cupredoxin domain-containing protein [Chloroflexota bacterium]|jgi:plastocyanin|nr:cupredoxin domain-containing protein [Chloroflexota bacterium]
MATTISPAAPGSTPPPPPAPPATTGRGRARRAGRSGLLIALLILGGSLLLVTPAALLSLRQEAISVQGGPAVTVEIVSDGMRFVPDEIRVPPGANVRIDFVNRDPSGTPHDLQTFGQRRDVRVIAWPGETKPTVFKSADRPGRYTFLCTIRGHSAAGHVGTIIVE